MSDDKANDQGGIGADSTVSTTVKKAAPKKKAVAVKKKASKKVAILFVKCKKDHFHRAGIRWVKDGYGVLVSDLTDDQVDAIMSEPMLVVEEGSINADALEGVVRVNQD